MVAFGRASLLLEIQVRNAALIDDLAHSMPMHIDYQSGRTIYDPSSLSDLKNRSENLAGRGQILPVLQVNSHSIDQKSGEICTVQANLQPISFKSDRLLETSVDHLLERIRQ